MFYGTINIFPEFLRQLARIRLIGELGCQQHCMEPLVVCWWFERMFHETGFRSCKTMRPNEKRR